MSTRLAPLALLTLVSLSTGCASTGATLNSGVGDAFLERAPYYAGRARPDTAPGARTGIMPVAYQAGATQHAMFEPAAGAGSPVARLLAR